MRFTNGSSKLGPNVIAVNRPVGHSCPIHCRFHPDHYGPLKNKCYMVRLEGMRPNIRKSAMVNMEANKVELINLLWNSERLGHLVRLHMGGDFFRPSGELDWDYIMSWVWALDRVSPLPRVLCYTHVIDSKELVRAFSRYPEFKLFASVHDQAELDVARKNGFARFAIAMQEKHYHWEDQNGGAWVERFGIKALVCPEQRGKIKDCGTCRYCWGDWKRGGHVAFLEHSQPNRRKRVTG